MNKQRTVRPQIGSFAIVPAWTPRRIRRAADSAAAFATGMTLYVILRLHATKDLLAIPRIETLAKEIAPDGAPVHVSTLKRAIKLLRAAGVIKTERRRNDRGAVVGTNYILIDVEPAQEDEQQLTGEPLPEGEGSSEQPLTGEPLSIGLQLTGEPDTSSQVSEWGASDRSITELHELNQKKDLSAKSVPTPAFTLIQDYVDGFFAAFGFKPVVGGREGKILKELAEQVGEDRVRLLLVHRSVDGTVFAPGWFFRSPDKWLKDTNSYTVPMLRGCANRLLLSYQPPAGESLTTEMDDWAPVLEQIKIAVGSHAFYTWFRNTTFIRRVGLNLVVNVPNPDHRGYSTHAVRRSESRSLSSMPSGARWTVLRCQRTCACRFDLEGHQRCRWRFCAWSPTGSRSESSRLDALAERWSAVLSYSSCGSRRPSSLKVDIESHVPALSTFEKDCPLCRRRA